MGPSSPGLLPSLLPLTLGVKHQEALTQEYLWKPEVSYAVKQSKEEKAKRKPWEAGKRNLIIEGQNLVMLLPVATQIFFFLKKYLMNCMILIGISKQTGESANGFTLLPTMKFKEREISKK